VVSTQIRVDYEAETRTAYCDLDGEEFVIRCPEGYDYFADRGQWIVKEVVQILNHRQLFDRG
jgi:hypothetical protein